MFRKGDRVLYVSPDPNDIKHLNEATVLGSEVFCPSLFIAIAFDEKVGKHDCNGRCMDGHGWYAYASHIEKISSEDIIFDAEDFDSLLR